jgi:hypothetical protein
MLNLKGRYHLADLKGGIILEWIQRNGMWKCVLDSTRSGRSTVAGSCEQGSELPSSVKNEGCSDLLSYYQLLKNAFSLLKSSRQADGCKHITCHVTFEGHHHITTLV